MLPSQPNPSANFLDEHHSIETPEQIRLQFTIAGIGSRFLAVAIDTLIQSAAAIVLAFLLGMASAFGLQSGRISGQWTVAVVIACYFLLYFGYFVLFEIFWGGQTPGKRAIGIRVIKENGRPLTAIEVIGRNLLRIVDQLPSVYLVGIITALLNKQGKRLGDFLAGSIVIQDKALKVGERPWEEATVPSGKSEFIGIRQLTPEEVTLMDAFLARRSDLDAATRHRMAGEVLQRIGRRILITSDQRTNPERTLEALSFDYRQG